ncbi:endopeptidase La [Clostridium senegalense]|uniref:endopeptidase La n=1 Tax=Clostridium senegalense TaxID=1465809 RepID=UPI001C101FB8|nr:endopeptidase La [Clostridium senegalense]MBU5226113.1 endopeptidase La [Clostridium senegalense]
MENNIIKLPLIPLRGLSIFPYNVLNFDVGREKSIVALETAMTKDQKIFLVSQKDAKVEDVEKDDIQQIGTICTVKQLVRLPENYIRVLVEGECRGKLIDYIKDESSILGEIEVIEDKIPKEDMVECQAYVASILESFQDYLEVTNQSMDVMIDLDEEEDLGRICDTIASYMLLKQSKKQELLSLINIKERLEKLLTIIKGELEIVALEKKIGIKVKSKIGKVQKEYYLREQIKTIQEELGEDDEEVKELREYESKMVKAKLPKEAREKALYELKRLKSSGASSQEGLNTKTYLDVLLGLPWGTITKDNLDIKNARKVLDENHYGMEDVKERIIEYLAVRKVSRGLKAPILCLVGPPGVGKTSIAESVSEALQRKFVRMSLGGVRDEAEIRGHRKTYVGAIPGRIINGMKKAGSKNPVFLLDEIDKTGMDHKGNIEDSLLEVLDPEQNNSFRDHYLELDFDLSKVLFITTANSLDTISRPLLDRMEIIEVSGYTVEEKFNIAKRHIVPKLLKEHNVKESQIKIHDSAIKKVVENYTRESGVRSLQRKLATLIRKAITELVEKDKEKIAITSNHVTKYLGVEIFSYDDMQQDDKIGVVTGLAWTAYGGDTLPIEVMVMEGNGKLELTGKLGDVMKESAKAAYSYVRSNAKNFSIKNEFYKNKDIHIHVPEGAVPKDGPSAGITMTTAMVSALSNSKVKHNVAMTGEVTLTGKVLPIGGLKEKSLAAYRMGIDTIIMPKDNKKDIDKLPKSVKNKIKFIPVENVNEVLKNALVIGEMNNGN